jgi:hypothetical protein
MIGKIVKENLMLLFLLVLVLFISTDLKGNSIYIIQSGSNLDLDITQDGQNNEIEALSGNGSAIVYGNNSTATFTQTGNSNQIRVWSDYSSGKSSTSNQTGNSNISLVDNHGQDNTITMNVTGNSNYTFNEIGNGGDTDNTITTTINGDSNNVIAEVQNGDNNTMDVQVQSQDNNIVRLYVNGNSNNSKVWQGKHEDGNIDNSETGDNDAYWYITGSSNTTASYQTDDNNNGGQYTWNDIDGSSNDIKITQRGAGDHYSWLDVNGDGNDIDVKQRGNSNKQTSTITVDDGHTVDVFQRYADHTATINLTNGGGGYNLDLDQTANTDQSYSLTGTCANSNGCGVTVTQN